MVGIYLVPQFRVADRICCTACRREANRWRLVRCVDHRAKVDFRLVHWQLVSERGTIIRQGDFSNEILSFSPNRATFRPATLKGFKVSIVLP